VTIEEATVDGRGCLDNGDDKGMIAGSHLENGLEGEEDRMLLDLRRGR
jgi:hypothetical protein